MAFIGNNVQVQGFTPAIDYFSGNGSTVTFTLSRPLASVAQIICAIDNVIQNPSSAYTVSGSSITFTSAPLSGTNNIWVEYTSLITTYAAISQSPSVIGDITATGGYLATGSFGNSFIDGTIVDYVTGNGRITVGPADGFTIYNNGTSARNALFAIDASGNVGIGTTSPTQKLHVVGSSIIGSGSSGTAFIQNTNPAGYATLQFSNDASQLGYVWQNGSTQTGYGGAGSLNIYTNGSQNISFGTNGSTERMRISSAGYVTMPYQPVFSAYGNQSSLASTSTVIPQYTDTTISSSYNTGNGRFTAPVAGTYYFIGSLDWNGATNGYYYGFSFKKNGGSVGQGIWQIVQGSNDNSVTQAIYLTLAAGDYVTMYASYQSTPSTTYSNFAGHLIG